MTFYVELMAGAVFMPNTINTDASDCYDDAAARIFAISCKVPDDTEVNGDFCVCVMGVLQCINYLISTGPSDNVEDF